MDDARKCYTEYIESEEYEENDGWKGALWAAMDIPSKFLAKEVYMNYEEAMASAICETEARSFAAGFNAGLRLWAARFMESNQWSMT
jgi:hypothetical protein